MDNEVLYELLDNTANMLRGMTLDPTIPQHAKAPMCRKIADIESLLPGLLTELEKA